MPSLSQCLSFLSRLNRRLWLAEGPAYFGTPAAKEASCWAEQRTLVFFLTINILPVDEEIQGVKDENSQSLLVEAKKSLQNARRCFSSPSVTPADLVCDWSVQRLPAGSCLCLQTHWGCVSPHLPRSCCVWVQLFDRGTLELMLLNLFLLMKGTAGEMC